MSEKNAKLCKRAAAKIAKATGKRLLTHIHRIPWNERAPFKGKLERIANEPFDSGSPPFKSLTEALKKI